MFVERLTNKYVCMYVNAIYECKCIYACMQPAAGEGTTNCGGSNVTWEDTYDNNEEIATTKLRQRKLIV